MDAPKARLAYSPEEAAKLLGLSRSGVYNLIHDGSLPSITLGRRRLIAHDALVALFAAAS